MGGFSGDGGPATSAKLLYPTGVAVDTAGNIYIADYDNNRIRKVTASTGHISTVAGGGSGCAGQTDSVGDGCQATSAELYGPSGVALDSAGNIYVADFFNERIRKVTASTGIISTVAGDGTAGFSADGGPATSAELYYPQGVALDTAGDIYIADYANDRIRKVTASTGKISTLAGGGSGTCGTATDSLGDGCPAADSQLAYPEGLTVDGAGNVYIADTNDERIRKVTSSTGIISAVAGDGNTGYSGDGGPATSAELYEPTGVGVDIAGNIYIADYGNNRIRKVTELTGIISTVAGDATRSYSGDGAAATSAELASPSAVGLDAVGNIYIADEWNQRIRAVGY